MKPIKTILMILIGVYCIAGATSLFDGISFYVSPFVIEIALIGTLFSLESKNNCLGIFTKILGGISLFSAIIGTIAMFINIYNAMDAVLSIVSGAILAVISVLVFVQKKSKLED